MFKALVFVVLFAQVAAAAPARLEGWSYRRNENGGGKSDETGEFNDAYDDPAEPASRPYIDEDGNDARAKVPIGGDKYRTPPVVSMQTLYDIKSGKIDSPFASGGDDDDDDDDDGEDGGDDDEDDDDDE